MDPESTLASIALDDEALAELRRDHPLAVGIPVIRRLLVEGAADAGLLVAVSDAAGRLLWVEGPSGLRSRAESMHFMPGADWSEASAGTNAPGTALALDRAVQIIGAEHLARPVTQWNCSAAPVHDPDTGAILGVIDVTGGDEVATSSSLGLVRATAAAVEAELQVQRLRGQTYADRTSSHVAPGWSKPRLDVLGAHGAVLRHGTSTTRLSGRHSEMMLLLAEAADGLTSAELAVALSEVDLPEVTIRAELSRLRTALGSFELKSRPYRLAIPLETDVARVRDELASGRLRAAVSVYRGPVLPGSQAPGVVDLRDGLHSLVRSHLLAGDDADALLSFADTGHGREDYEIWHRVLEVLPRQSPRHAHVVDHLERLDRELA